MQRQPQVGIRASGHQDAHPGHLRFFQPDHRLVRRQIGESVSPPAGAFQVPLQEQQPGTEGACPVVFAAPLLQVKLADRLHHLPGFRTLLLDLVDQRQAGDGIAISSYLGLYSDFRRSG